MEKTNAAAQPEPASGKSVRLHYLDWLRVLAILGVFLFHALSSFVVTLGLYEVFIRRVGPLRGLFGMKPQRREMPLKEAG